MAEQTPLRVLHVEDREADSQLVALALRRAGCAVQIRRVVTAGEMQAALQEAAWEAVISDYSLPQFDALQALAVLHQSGLDIPFIIVSGTIDEVEATAALRAGAHDFITKANLARLAPAIEREVRQAENRRQRRATPALLREQEAGFRLLFERNSLPMWVYDAATLAFLEVNQSAIAHYGYSRDEFLRMTIADIRPPEDIPGLLADVQAERPDFRPVEQHGRHRLKSGQIIDVEITAHALTFRGQAAVMVVAHDVTDRSRAEAALVNSEKRFRALIENSAEAITLIGRDGRVLYDSPAAPKMLGYGPDELIGRNAFELFHPDDVAPNQARLRELLDQPMGQARSQFRLRHKDGAWRWIEAVTSNLLADPNVQAIVVNYRDTTERQQAEVQIQSQLERLAALRAIDLAITSSLDLKVTLDVFMEQVITQLGVDATDVLLLDPADQRLTYTAGRGFRSSNFQQTRLRLGEGRAGRAAQERQIVTATGLGNAQRPSMRTSLLGSDDFVSYYGVPLIAKGQVVGVLEIFNRTALKPDPAWLEFLEALASQAAIAIENATLFDSLQRSHQHLTLAYDATIEGWSRALDLRDRETEGHSQRVTKLALRLARVMQMPEAELVQMRRGALLHDMGKIGIPDHILLKPGPLTEAEWLIMREHPAVAYKLLSPISYLRPALDIPYCHHEKWDGTGYPRGLRGEEIPLAARLFAVVDVWDALGTDRPYRPAWPIDEVLEHIRSLAGSHLDPQAVEVFLKVVGSTTKYA